MKTKSFASEHLLLTTIIAITLGTGFWSMPAGAADTDLDGYTDEEEGNGSVAGGSPTDPAKKDVNIYLVPDSKGSNFGTQDPSVLLEFLGERGLGLVTHSATSRQVTTTQKALYIREVAASDLNPTGTTLGETPVICHTNCASGATVYTQRIRNYLRSKCATAPKCYDYFGGNIDFKGQLTAPLTAAPPPGSVEEKYIKHNLAHEGGHNMYLKNPQDRTVGFHYKPSTTGNVMDQFAYTKTDSKTNNVTWYIGTTFPSADKSSLKLTQ